MGQAGVGLVVVVLYFDCPYKLNAASQVLNPKSRSFKNAPSPQLPLGAGFRVTVLRL